MSTHYFVGLDLGQAQDFTALATIEAPAKAPAGYPVLRMPGSGPPALKPGGFYLDTGRELKVPERPPEPPVFNCTYLDRFPLGTNYLSVVQRVADLLSRPPLKGASTLVLDATGVGRPVRDMFTAWGLRPRSILIHGGSTVTHHGLDYNVPKRDLVGALQVLLQARRLRFAGGLPHTATLTAELRDYRVELSPVGHDSYSARSGQHDDLILATACACWFAKLRTPDPTPDTNRPYPAMQSQ